ncbi:metal ABC transporter ATP-binding protein [Salinispira pacifica]
MSHSAVVVFDRVDFRYPGVPVIENASFELEETDFASIIGPNGGGKTTLARLILGLASPSSGTISVFGRPPQASRRRIGYVPQYAAFDPNYPVTLREVALMGRVGPRPGFRRRRDLEAADNALEQVGLTALRSRPFAELSGGQRQRVLIARALASGPEILLLDEPTANVDAAVEHQLNALLHRLNEKLTILLITHDLGFVSELVNRVVCVNREVKVHPTSEVTAEMIQELYGGHIRRVDHEVNLRRRGEDAPRTGGALNG